MGPSPANFGEAFAIIFCIYAPLILLTVEAWWFWYWFSYGDTTHKQLYIIEITTGALIILTIAGVIKGILFTGFLAIPVPLVIWFLMKQQEDKTDKLNAILRERAEIKRILNVIDNAKEPALLYKAIVELGDLYVTRMEFEKAIGCYRRADEIVDTSQTKGLLGMSARIKLAEKEIRIKKGEIWVCAACSYDNPGDIKICKMCGNMRNVGKSLKQDIVMQKREIKEDAVSVIFPVFAITAGILLLFLLAAVTGFLYGHMPWWASVPLIIITAAFSIFFFFKFLAYIRDTVIPKMLK